MLPLSPPPHSARKTPGARAAIAGAIGAVFILCSPDAAAQVLTGPPGWGTKRPPPPVETWKRESRHFQEAQKRAAKAAFGDTPFVEMDVVDAPHPSLNITLPDELDASPPGAPSMMRGELSEPLKLAPREDPPREVARVLLARAAELLEAREFDAAEDLLAGLQTLPMSRAQSHTFKYRQAQLAHFRGDHQLAAGLLRLLEDTPELRAELRGELLLTLADSLQALGRAAGAVEALLRRDKIDLQDNLSTHLRILDLVDSLDPLNLLLLRENAPDAEGWIALSEVLKSPPAERRAAARRWRAYYRGHPATRALHRRLEAPKEEEGAPRYRHIAMLLPLTSNFGGAARAFYEGFMHAHAESTAEPRPEVSLHDIGDDPSIAPLYSQNAIAGGADFLVGPLGRRAVGALLEAGPPKVPALLIGGVPPGKTAPALYGISLAPEQDARQTAERAFLDGNRRAGIFYSDSPQGWRIAKAFEKRWSELGGEVIGNAALPSDIATHSRVIRKLLGIDRSNARARALGAQLGIGLEFTPRRRGDIDFLFLAAGAAEVRILAPQLRFFHAHNLALYATSQIFSGEPNPVIDADLDGVIFGDADWMLDALGRAEWRAPSPYHHSELDRLFALGMESYNLIPLLSDLRREPWRRYFGEAFELSIRQNGNARRHLAWAQFNGGKPVRIPPPATREN